MARKFNVDINLNGNILKNVRLDILATHPSSPEESRIYYNSDQKAIYFYDGSEWIKLPSDGSLADIDISENVKRIMSTVNQSFNLKTMNELTVDMLSPNDFIKEMFYPDIKTTMSIVSNALLEVGDNAYDWKPAVTIHVNDWKNTVALPEDYLYKDFYINLDTGEHYYIAEPCGSGAGCYPTTDMILSPYTFSGLTSDLAEADREIHSLVTVRHDGIDHSITSPSIYARWRFPSFYGLSSNSNLYGETLYTTLTKILLASKWTVRTLTFNIQTGDYIYIAVPSSWGYTGFQITDNGGAGDDVSASFESDTKTITRPGGWAKNYFRIKSKTAYTVGEQVLKVTLS